MKNLEQEIQDVIKKNLSEEVGSVVRERLELIPKLENENQSLRKLLDEQRGTSESLNNKLQEYMRYATVSAGFDQRERELKEKEIKFEVDSLKVKLEAEQYKSQFSKEIALGLVRNSEYRKEVFNNNNVSGRSTDNGVFIQPYSESNSSTETRKVD